MTKEAFERYQAKEIKMDYEELKSRFDFQERHFDSRYASNSEFSKEYKVWCAAWAEQQKMIDELEMKLSATRCVSDKRREEVLARDQKIDEQAQQLKQAYEDIETFAKEMGSEANFKAQYAKQVDEQQKRLDAVQVALKAWINEAQDESRRDDEDWVSNILNRCIEDLEKALRG